MLKIERAYILALTIIALTISVSQFFSQRFITYTKVDSRVVNISGRQRMLSQKICKSAIKLVTTNDSIVFEKSKTELSNAVELWTKSHHALQYGDKELGIYSINNSDTVLFFFKKLNPAFKTIAVAAHDLAENITYQERTNTQWQNYLNQILDNENIFLTTMDEITFQYDIEARQKMCRLSLLDYILYAFAILLLLMEAFFIFRPALKRLKFTTQQLVERERQLEQAKVEKIFLEKLKAKNKELEQFNYITSHDLQEPLNSIISFSNLLKASEDKLDDIGVKSIEVIIRLSNRMKNFITSLLEYSRIGRNKEKSLINIKELLKNLQIDLHSLIKKEDATINYIGADLTLTAIETEMIRLFQNLITNAIKYHQQRIKPIVIIDSKEQADEYKFSVEDNGIGIDEQYFDKIFEVFQRLHTRDKYYGTGIGLSYCKKIVEIHNGKIWLDSEVGKGTTFYFTISKNL